MAAGLTDPWVPRPRWPGERVDRDAAPPGTGNPAGTASRTGFSGVVLAGGRSSRMGVDKALVAVDGVPMAELARRALVGAGAAELVAVGGDLPALGEMGFVGHPDDHPGAGPLGGILTALRVATHDPVVVLACDLPLVDAAGITEVLAALGPADDAAVPERSGRLEPLHAAYRHRCLPALERAFGLGERAPHRALALVAVRRVALSDPGWLRNVNRPEDVP